MTGGTFWAKFSSSGRTGRNIWIIPWSKESGAAGKPTPYFVSESYVVDPKFSPDDQLVAYGSNESQRFEVYVRTFPIRPANGRFRRLEEPGPSGAVTARNSITSKMTKRSWLSTSRMNGGKLELGVPKLLFSARTATGSGPDVTKDGRFLIPVD